MNLDAKDRAALATVAIIAVIAVSTLLLTAIAAGLAVRLFLLVGGV